jgi:hypothetical protein
MEGQVRASHVYSPRVDDAAILRYIAQTYPDADIFTASSGTFMSCDGEKNWPNFATLVTSDEYDPASDLDRPGVYRLNIGVSKATFESVAGSNPNPDDTALDQLMPHPVYAMQHWVSILNPSEATFDMLVKPLLDEAHERVARARRKVADKKSPTLVASVPAGDDPPLDTG